MEAQTPHSLSYMEPNNEPGKPAEEALVRPRPAVVAPADFTPPDELYQQLVARIKEQSPEAQIHIISMTYVAAGAGKKRLNNTNIRAFNATMKEIAAKEGWGFVNMADPLADGNGDLAKAYCSDNYVHQTPAAYKVWTGVLRAYAREVLSRQEAAK